MNAIITAAGLLTKIAQLIAAAPDAIAAAKKFAPGVLTAYKVLKGEITGQDALDDIAAKEADIDAHFAHMETEAEKLGQ